MNSWLMFLHFISFEREREVTNHERNELTVLLPSVLLV